MKNDYCKLSRAEIDKVPERFKGFFLSPFQWNLRAGMVGVPEDTFAEMIAIIAEHAQQQAHAGADEALTVRVPTAAYLWLMGLGEDGYVKDREGNYWYRGAFNERAGLDMVEIDAKYRAAIRAAQEGEK